MDHIQDIGALGELVMRTRKQQGVTQAELSAACGVGVRFIRELEHGKPTCQVGKVMQVAQALGLSFHLKSR